MRRPKHVCSLNISSGEPLVTREHQPTKAMTTPATTVSRSSGEVASLTGYMARSSGPHRAALAMHSIQQPPHSDQGFLQFEVNMSTAPADIPPVASSRLLTV
jgi:hypothetical protein